MKKIPISILAVLITIFCDYHTASAFVDVPDHHRYHTAISTLTDEGIVNGYAENKIFAPQKPISRAEFIKLILSLAKPNVDCEVAAIFFTDVSPSDWFFQDVCRANMYGILDTVQRQFSPHQPITLIQASIWIDRITGQNQSPQTVIAYLQDANVIPAELTQPSQIIRRGQAAAMIVAAGDLTKNQTSNAIPPKERGSITAPNKTDKIDEVLQTTLENGALFYEPTPAKTTKTIAEYNIIDNRLERITEKRILPQHQKLFDIYIALFPQKYRQRFTEFHIISDGIGGTTGEVFVVKDPIGWAISFDIADIDDIYYTMAHELAHAIAISKSEQAKDAAYMICRHRQENDCDDLKRSFFVDFEQEFWLPYPRLQKAVMQGFSADDMAIIIEPELRGGFLTDYATTAAIEDFSESFAHYLFVAETDDYTGIAKQKLEFFNRYSELKTLRKDFRQTVYNMINKNSN
jgi:hypothetical protein